ncbi:MAG: hypothetical protein F6K11_33805 [Leptolyngbya sp. SIO3F4]|nr:hypothetical protein [Leptolyngbya sp. SIO3F4]
MSNHFIDSHGKVIIGSGTTLGGRDTQFWGHSLTFDQPEIMLSPLEIIVGENVYIGARSTLLQCNIPDNAVIGAGSVVTKEIPPEDCRLLIAGNPAKIKKRYPLVASLKPETTAV